MGKAIEWKPALGIRPSCQPVRRPSSLWGRRSNGNTYRPVDRLASTDGYYPVTIPHWISGKDTTIRLPWPQLDKGGGLVPSSLWGRRSNGNARFLVRFPDTLHKAGRFLPLYGEGDRMETLELEES